MSSSWLNTIHHGTAEDMRAIPDSSVHLVVTSPPYNVGIKYGTHDDNMPEAEYIAMIGRVFADFHRVLVPGGRAAINVANVGRTPYVPLTATMHRLLTGAGLMARGEVIWHKGDIRGGSNSTAWGSWCSPANPSVRDEHEYVLIYSKGGESLAGPCMGDPDILPDEFLDATRSVWRFYPASAKRVGHPAPFPLELPARLIKLYTWPGQVILDPFAGSGTTCLAANQLGRHYVGFDIDANYVQLARARLSTLFGLETAHG